MYEFKKEYEIGIDFIDEQHRILFEIEDKAYNLLKMNLHLINMIA